MTVNVANGIMSSPDTHHVAVPVNSTSWKVTFLRPDHRLTRHQALLAMQIAAVVGAAGEPITARDPIWRQVNTWAHELGLDGIGAIGYASQPRRWEVSQ